MNLLRFHYFLLLLGLLIMAACTDDNELPDEPVINAVTYDETGKDLVINFTDGDGNFGLPSDLIDPPFQAWEDSLNGIINKKYNNLWLDVFVKEENGYVLVETSKSHGFDFRIPFLTPQGQNKQLRVTATYDLSPDFGDFLASGGLTVGDTLKFNVVLIDRDLNISNTFVSEGHVLRE